MRSLDRLGWIVAAAIVGLIAAAGFQGSLDKVAMVDLSRMVETSNLGKSNIAALESMKGIREDLLKFIDDTRVLTIDQAKNLRALWLKESATPADKAALDTLKAEINLQATKNKELGQKPNLTAEERTLLQEYANRSAAMEQLAGQWYQEFSQDIQKSAQDRRVDTLNKAKAAAQSVAKAQGYTLVFDNSVAVYAANDLTEPALQAMNAKS